METYQKERERERDGGGDLEEAISMTRPEGQLCSSKSAAQSSASAAAKTHGQDRPDPSRRPQLRTSATLARHIRDGKGDSARRRAGGGRGQTKRG